MINHRNPMSLGAFAATLSNPTRHACLVWVWDAEDGWTAPGEPVSAIVASREVRELADVGIRAKALPLGTKPLVPEQAFTPAVKTP